MVKHECEKCKRAKDRIASILRKDGYYTNVTIDDELKDKKGKLIPKFPNQVISEFLPAKDYYPDIYAEKIAPIQRDYPVGLVLDGKRISKIVWYGQPQPVIIEVDHKSHTSDMSTVKDNRRDKHFLSKNIPTVRFSLKMIVGRDPVFDSDIRILIEREIEYQLQSKALNSAK